ncbi:MAG TPA: hypothetical protein VGB24_06515 [Longimicrobium sp.]|jgi:hypothetical protein|uniref:hypothetical protein n=1 Tax=Longimicrobium sp. TaxID=2029185 RepID=UPI002ED85345
MFLLYGFAKLMGSQFTILDSELDKPMGEVSGFWLTWYYFGYSAVYGSFIAVSQICGALLLTFRRTTLLGACLLFGITTNIVLVDLCYGVEPGGTATAIILWCCLLGMVLFYREALMHLFWRATAGPRHGGVRRAAAWSIRCGMVVLAASFTYWVANYNNRLPTPLDGAWEVRARQGGTGQAMVPARIYFERNRAHMVVFRHADRWTTHHFEIDPASRGLHVWDEWLRKGEIVFRGTYTLQGDRMELRGRFAGSQSTVALQLVRIGPGHRGPAAERIAAAAGSREYGGRM